MLQNILSQEGDMTDIEREVRDYFVKTPEGQRILSRNVIKMEIHKQTGEVLGFKELGLNPSFNYRWDFLEEHGISRELYEKTYDSIMRFRVRIDPIVRRLFPEYSQYLYPTRAIETNVYDLTKLPKAIWVERTK